MSGGWGGGYEGGVSQGVATKRPNNLELSPDCRTILLKSTIRLHDDPLLPLIIVTDLEAGSKQGSIHLSHGKVGDRRSVMDLITV